MGYLLNEDLLFYFILILIGQMIYKIVNLQLDIVHFWLLISSRGVQTNNPLLKGCPLKLNTGL